MYNSKFMLFIIQNKKSIIMQTKNEIFDKYFLNKKPYNGQIAIMITHDILKEKQPKNVLLVRTPTTGGWLEEIEDVYISKNLNTPNVNIVRLLYKTKVKLNGNWKELYDAPECTKTKEHTKIIEQSDIAEVVNTWKNNNMKFDLICIDPFHDFERTLHDFNLFSSLLTDRGILISHDCAPKVVGHATPNYKPGPWCGLTYAAFIQFANQNPAWYYTVLDTDTGIGIMSKTSGFIMKNNLNVEKQQIFLQMLKNNLHQQAFDYFRSNGEEIVNLISQIK